MHLLHQQPLQQQSQTKKKLIHKQNKKDNQVEELS
jgi:hypothetical protein